MLIKPYTPSWITNFKALKTELDKALLGCSYRIEHIGSTSIPKLDAKDIIDIDIIYKAEAEFEYIKTGLAKIGYDHKGNQGISGREVFKRRAQQSHKILDKIRHHLYVCPAKSQAVEQHILFRDHLRKHEGARAKYQEMKYKLAEMAQQDKKLYAELKELKLKNFFEAIIETEKTGGKPNP